jgi:hypothetical protein
MDMHVAKVRNIGLNDPVDISLPAYVWVQFWAAYANTEWADPSANIIAGTIRNTFLDPIELSEQDAQIQEQRDQLFQTQAGMFGAMGVQFGNPDDPRLGP